MPHPRVLRAVRATLAVLAASAAGAMAACSLVVSTDGLSGASVADAARPPVGDDSAVAAPGDAAAADAATVTDGGAVVDVVADASPDEARTLPPGAVTWSGNGHAYLVVIDTNGVSWTEARSRAEQAGGHLATIGSAAENDFVLALAVAQPMSFQNAGVGPWLGAWQPKPTPEIEPGGGWAWIDGTPWGYTAWQVDQPDNTAGAERYLDLYRPVSSVAWNDDLLNGNGAPIVSYVVEID